MSDRSAFTADTEARRSWIVSSVEKLSQTLCSESLLGYRRAGYALLAVFVMLEMMLIVGGTPPVDEPWDTNLLLNGGWRIVSGQVPHTDFHNPIGALPYLLVAFGMKVAAPSTSSIAYGSVLLLAILLPWPGTLRRLGSRGLLPSFLLCLPAFSSFRPARRVSGFARRRTP